MGMGFNELVRPPEEEVILLRRFHNSSYYKYVREAANIAKSLVDYLLSDWVQYAGVFHDWPLLQLEGIGTFKLGYVKQNRLMWIIEIDLKPIIRYNLDDEGSLKVWDINWCEVDKLPLAVQKLGEAALKYKKDMNSKIRQRKQDKQDYIDSISSKWR